MRSNIIYSIKVNKEYFLRGFRGRPSWTYSTSPLTTPPNWIGHFFRQSPSKLLTRRISTIDRTSAWWRYLEWPINMTSIFIPMSWPFITIQNQEKARKQPTVWRKFQRFFWQLVVQKYDHRWREKHKQMQGKARKQPRVWRTFHSFFGQIVLLFFTDSKWINSDTNSIYVKSLFIGWP